MGFFSKRSTSPPKGKGKGLDIEKGGRYDDEDKLAKFKQADAKDGCMRRMMRKLCTCAFLFVLISLFFILYESGHIELKINPFNRKKFAKTAYARLEKTVDVSTKAYEVVEHVASTGSIDTEKVNQFMEAATDFVGLEDSSDDYDKSSSNDGQDSADGSNDEEQVQGEEDAEQETEIQQEGTPPPPPVTNEMTQGEQQQQPQQGMAQEQQQQSQPQQGMAQEQQEQSQPQQGMAQEQQQQQQFQPQQGMAQQQQQQQQFQPQQGMAQQQQQQFQPQQGTEQQ